MDMKEGVIWSIKNRTGLTRQITDYVINNKEQCYRLAFSYTRNQEDALEVVQESIVKAISSMNSLRSPKYMKTWFYRIIVNSSLDLLRRKKKVIAVDDNTLSNMDSGAPDEYSDVDLHKGIDGLRVVYRSIVILRYFEDLKIEEIAHVLKLNENTVKTRLYKA